MATPRSVQRAKANVTKRTAQAKRTAVKKGQALASKGQKAVRSSAIQARKAGKATVKKASDTTQSAHTTARKAGAAIGRILGRAQGMGRKLMDKAKKKLT